jgi:hypothetical protein
MAQAGPTDGLDIRVSPTTPAPGARTTVTLTSTSFDLGSSQIAWTLDGNASAAGPGERSFTFTMGPAGRSTVIGITVTPRQGARITRTLTFRPASVTLLWEADTYTPPLYKGRALYSAGAGIRILAIPSVLTSSGASVPSSELIFKWQIGEQAYADRSGLGRDTLLITGSQLREEELVGVTVLRRDGSEAAAAAIRIPATAPLARLYRADELRGVRYERALAGEEPLTTTETTIVAEPYFLSGNARMQPGFTYAWSLNGKEVEPQGEDRTVITLRQQGGEGRATLEFSVESNAYSKLLQSAGAALIFVLGDGRASIF